MDHNEAAYCSLFTRPNRGVVCSSGCSHSTASRPDWLVFRYCDIMACNRVFSDVFVPSKFSWKTGKPVDFDPFRVNLQVFGQAFTIRFWAVKPANFRIFIDTWQVSTDWIHNTLSAEDQLRFPCPPNKSLERSRPADRLTIVGVVWSR